MMAEPRLATALPASSTLVATTVAVRMATRMPMRMATAMATRMATASTEQEAAAECGCETQLDCARDANCPSGSICCIANQQDAACASGHYVATCQATCTSGQHMCDPNAQQLQCSTGQTCNPDTGGVNLPIAGFGVCN